MRKLAMPTDDPSVVFRTCISIVADQVLRDRLASVEATIATAADEFADAATVAMLHTLPPHDNVGGVVSRDEMSDVYTLRMAKQKTPGRSIYDKLIAAPAYGRCPLCGQGAVSTLDHHLPKARYPALAVVPTNLIPACAICNKVKLNAIPQTAEEQTLHPYFDDVDGEQWLRAAVIEASPATLRFFVNAPLEWSPLQSARVHSHFVTFKLAALYASYSGEEIVNIRYALDKLFQETGAEGVKHHLQHQAETYEAAHRNSWQTAMYGSLVANNWFCEGGFQS